MTTLGFNPTVVSESVGRTPMVGTPGARKAEMLAKRTQALTYRLAGMSYGQIAEACGYTEAAQARNMIMAALRETVSAQVDDLRELENMRLDRQLAAIWTQVLAGDISAGSLALRLSERRAKLNGLDRPTAVTVTPDMNEVHAWVQQVLALSQGGEELVREPDITVIDGEVADDDDDATA